MSSLHHSFNKYDAQAREYFWGYVLSKDSPTVTWSFTEEDDDSDFMDHTLFLKHATLGSSAVHNERNIVQVETTNYESKEVKQPLFSLTSGVTDSFALDISFVGKTPVIFKLVEGSGPVHLSGQQLVEFPPDDDVTQDETELLEDTEELGELDDSKSKDKKAQKRKAPPQSTKSKKKGKMEISAESDDDSEEVEEEDEEEMEDEEEEEDLDEDDDEDDEDYESPNKGKKGSKTVKGKEKTIKKGAKKVEKVASKVVKKQIVKKAKK